MKKHAAFFKTIAAFIMLTALLTLLLPLGKITTATKSATVSGAQVLKIGMNVGYEYYNKGKIEDDYSLASSMTWGDLKAGATYVGDNHASGKVVAAGIIAALPIVFCFLSMCLTLIARGKKTMFLSTLIIALAFVENIMLIMIFLKLEQVLLPYMNVTLLIGMYAFTALIGIALGILGMLWITGGFSKPEDKNQDSDEKKDKGKKKNRFLDSNRGKEKRKKRRKKKKQNKKRNKKNKQGKEKNYAFESAQEESNYDSLEHNQHEELRADSVGRILGIAGMYQGIDEELSKLVSGTFTIGTTPETIEAIQKGNIGDIDRIAKNSCIIEYSEAKRQYKVSSYSVTEILMRIDEESKELIRLQHGESQIVSANTLLYIGNDEHRIRLE